MKQLFFAVFGCFLLIKATAQCSASPDFVDNYNSAVGWTTVNKTSHPTVSNVIVTTGVVKYTSLKDGREQRIVKELPFLLNDKAWVAECRINIQSSNLPSHLVMAFTENNNDCFYTQSGQLSECGTFAGTVTNQDALFCNVFDGGSSRVLFVGYKDGTTLINNLNAGIAIPSNNTNYYIRFQRTDFGIGVISVFSNAAMTSHIAGSPQCFPIPPGNSIANLKYIQHGAITMGGCSRTISMELDDLKIYNRESPCPLPLTSSFTVNSVICQGYSIVCNGSASSSGSSIPINDHVWIVQQCDAGGNTIPSSVEWWSPFIVGAPGIYTIPTVNGPQIQCGKYYKITLALQNCGNLWATSSRVVFIECAPVVAISASNQTVCPNVPVTLTATVSGTGGPYTYTWRKISPLPFQVLVTGSPNNQLVVTPGVTSTYQVIVNSAHSCNSSASRTITVYPATFTKNISTGYDNSATNTNPANVDFPLVAFGAFDDEWINASNPGGYTHTHPICVQTGLNNSFPPTANARWVTIAGNPGFPTPINELNPGPRAPFVYEYPFTLPAVYANATLTINKFGVDDIATIYLDGVAVVTLNAVPTSSNYMIGTTVPVSVPITGAGPHLIKCVVQQDTRWTALFIDGVIIANCQ